MITKRIGNDIRVEWAVFMKSGEKADFSSVRTMDVFVRHSRSGKLYPQAFVAFENVIKFDFVASEQYRTGVYDLVLKYTISDVGIEGGFSTTIADNCNVFALKDIVCDDPDDSSQISVVTILEKGDKGSSAYQVAVEEGYEGTIEEWLQSLKQPAIDAGEEALNSAAAAVEEVNVSLQNVNSTMQGVSNTMQEIEQSEEQRRANEKGRVTNELLRVDHEGERVSAEYVRSDSEDERKIAEVERASAEEERLTKEEERKTAEGERKTSETGRVSAEGERKTAETARKTAETARETAETGRVTAETGRVTAEKKRQTDTTAAVTNVQNWLETADSTLTGKQDKLAIDKENGDPDKVLNEQGDFAQLQHGQLNPLKMNIDSNFQHITTEEKERFSGKAEIEDIDAQREELFRVVNIGSEGMVTLKPTTRNFTYKLTVLDNVLINIDLSKMIDQIGSARARFIVDIPIAKTITWAKPLLWSGDIPDMTAGQYIFEIVNIGETPLIWMVASTQKKAYSGVTLFVDSEGANYIEEEINGEVATREDSSWANPFKYLQNAINAAQAGDVIFVKEGTYKPTHLFDTVEYSDGDHFDRTASITPKKDVDIYGGFRGDELHVWEREYREGGYPALESVISGDLQSDDNEDHFANHIMRTTNISSGFTYFNGFVVEKASGAIEYAGGIRSGSSGAFVSINCIIRNCSGALGGGWSYGTNYNCIAQECTAAGNGGGWSYGTNYNCIAQECTATGNGGGWSIGTNYNCIAQECTADSTGGGWISGSNYNCIAENCTADSTGGGWINGNNYNCIAENCTAGSAGGGWRNGNNYNCIALNCKGLDGGGFSYGTNYNCSVINCESESAVYNHPSALSESHINTLLLGNRKSDGTTAAAYANNVNTELKYVFRNNATDVAVLPSVVSSNVESDINLMSCITGITTTAAGVTIPSFAGLPTTEAQRQELKEYVKNIKQHLKPKKTSILKGAGVNNATYPNPTDFEDVERPENCTIGAFEADEDNNDQ